MPENEPTAKLHPDFSQSGATAPPWSDVVDVLTNSEMFWLSTVRRDGRPHVTPLPAIWLDGTLYFCTGTGEQKAKNLDSDPRCVLTTGTTTFRSGLDVVVEGSAVRVTERALLTRLAALWKSRLDWDWQVGDTAFRAPEDREDREDGEVPVFGVTPTKVLAFGKSPYTQTRYTP